MSKNKKMTLNKYLRKALHKAQWDRKDECCWITGRTDNLESHHDGKSFSWIVTSSLKNLNIPYYKYIEDYNLVDLVLIKNEVLRLHSLYAKPVTLSADIHLELHRTYGTRVSHEQLEEYCKEYQNNKNEKAVC